MGCRPPDHHGAIAVNQRGADVAARLRELHPEASEALLDDVARLEELRYYEHCNHRALAEAVFNALGFDRYVELNAEKRAVLERWGITPFLCHTNRRN